MTGLGERFIWWIGLNFGLVLTPLVFNAFSGSGVGWQEAIRHGELMIVAVAIGGLGLATAVAADTIRSSLRELRALLCVGGMIFILADGLLYADNYRAVAEGKHTAVATQSYCLIAFALIYG